MDPDLLQAFEHALETLARLTTVTQRLIDAQERGETLPASALDDYAQQLKNITADRERLQDMLTVLWQTIGDHTEH